MSRDLGTFTVALTTGTTAGGYEYLGAEIRNEDGSLCDSVRITYGPDGPDGVTEANLVRAVREMVEEYVDTWLTEEPVR